MIVWGGYDGGWVNDTGGVYTPSTNTWRPTGMSGVPEERELASAIWTGTEMIVWGGYSFMQFNTTEGGRYNVATDRWNATSLTNVPEGRSYQTHVWTGAEMIVWGGSHHRTTNTGGRYDPATETWRATSTGANVPAARFLHTGVWTGSQMLVWGGLGNWNFNRLSSGSAYCACPDGSLVYRDVDGDGYGDPANALPRCDGSRPPGYARMGIDCDDGNANVHPGTADTCNGVDDDCNGVVDDCGDALCEDGAYCIGLMR